MIDIAKIKILTKKEWRALVFNPIGYIFAALLMVIVNWLFFSDFFLLGQANLVPFWSTMTFLFSIFVPAIAMGLLAEEKRSGTWEILLSLPIDEIELVIGKFLGGALYLLAVISLSAVAVATMFILGKPDMGVIAGGLVGVIMLGWAYLAVGLLASSLTDSPVTAFLGATVFLLLNNLAGQEMVLAKAPWFLKNLLANISLGARASKFFQGLMEAGDVVFFVSWILFFMILAIMCLKARDK